MDYIDIIAGLTIKYLPKKRKRGYRMLKVTLDMLLSLFKQNPQAAEEVVKHAERIGRSSGYRSGLRKAAEIIKECKN